MQVTLFPYLLTDSSPMLREIGSEVQRHFLQHEPYSFHFWCERTLTVAKTITFGISFVIKKQISKPSPDDKNLRRSKEVMHYFT